MLDLKISEIGGHVSDADSFHLPFGYHIPLPNFGPLEIGGTQIWDGQITKFMVLELIVAVLMVLVFIPLARRIVTGGRPVGRFWNFFEAILVFLRDEVARPSIGRKDADRFLPYVWNIFFFILFCNLMGMLPWAGSPTGSLFVTGALAAVAFGTVVGTGMARHGVLGFWTGMVPPMELPGAMAVFLKPMLLGIEIAGLVIRHTVLAVRLLANMFAGHLVLAVMVAFIGATANTFIVLWCGVTIGSVLGSVALSLLELFVAFLQAYIFTFLSALFIGMAVHQH